MIGSQLQNRSRASCPHPESIHKKDEEPSAVKLKKRFPRASIMRTSFTLMTLALLALVCDVVSAAGNCQLTVDDSTVNAPTAYTFTFRPSRSSGNIRAMKFTFTTASGILPQSTAACTPSGNTAAFQGAAGCTATLPVPPSTADPFIVVTNLSPNQFSYQVDINSIVNAPYSGMFNDIRCEFCTDTTCNSLYESGTNARITFTEATLPVANVEILSSETQNGAEGATMTIGMLLGNKIVPKGTLTFDLPKQNYHYISLGASNRECLLYFCDSSALTVNIWVSPSKADMSGPNITTEAGICNGSPGLTVGTCFLYEESDFLHDRITIQLANTADIAATQYLRVTIYPVKNFPSMAPVKDFKGFTGNNLFKPIEKFELVSFANTLPNEFSTSSSVKIVGSTDTSVSDNYQVGADGLIYEFDVYLQYNDIPNKSKFRVAWPNTWVLDCTKTYTVDCSIGCSFSNGSALICDETINGLELYGGFDLGTSTPYINYQVGHLKFQIGGISNPDTTTGQYFTLTSYHQQGDYFMIDSTYLQFYVEFNTGSVDVEKILPTKSLLYSTLGFYYFKFRPQHTLKVNYVISIQIPPELDVQQNSACIISEVPNGLTEVAATFDCAADATNNQIVIQNFLVRDNQAGDWVEIYIDSIRNPGDFVVPGTVYFKIETSTGGDVDSGSYTDWEAANRMFKHSFIPTFSVSADDTTAGKQPVTYAFSLTPFTRVTQGAYLIIDLPDELEVVNSERLARACQQGEINGFSNTIISCSYLSSTHQVKVINGFRFKYSDGDPPNIYFQISQFRNPRSLAPSSDFNVTIYNQVDALLFSFNQSIGPSIQMNKYQTPNFIEYTRSSYENGAITNYTWQIETANQYRRGDKIKFTLPLGIRFTDNTQAVGTSFWLDGPMQAVLSGDRQSIEIKVELAQRRRNLNQIYEDQQDEDDLFEEDWHTGRRQLADVIPAGSIINLNLTKVTSPISLRPVEGTITYQVNDDKGYMVEAITAGISVGNTLPGVINSVTAGITPDYWENNVLANYTLAFSPNNWEQNLQIWITIPEQIRIPTAQERNLTVRGLKGTDAAEITSFLCGDEEMPEDFVQYCKNNRTILLTDAVTAKDVAPASIELSIESLFNPGTNLVTDSFEIVTRTYDGYQIDSISEGLSVNFYCLFPCRSCIEETPSICLSCYTATTSYIYLFDDTCMEQCPPKMYAMEDKAGVPTCGLCDFPCKNCGDNSTDCLDCYPGWIHYEIDHTCYEEINWLFPFLQASVVSFLVVFIADCIKRSTDFLQSLLFFLTWCELAVVIYLISMWVRGDVEGDRSLTVISLGVQALLNLCFMGVHCKLMIRNGSQEYKQVFKEYPTSSWIISAISYLFDFKLSVFLVSSFAARPRWSGTLNQDGWQKFNIFALLYIALVYLPFTADFYLYFTTYGLRKLTSFVAAEACVIRTIICLILMLEILSQCACAGINESDLGRRAGLAKDKKGKGKKKRRALRSGMGNDEEDYGEEYGSSEEGSYLDLPAADAEDQGEYEYYDEEDAQPEDEEAEEEYYDEEDEEIEVLTKKKTLKKSTTPGETPGNQEQLDMLEKLAKQMKDEKDALKAEQQQILDEKKRILEEKEKYLDQFGDINDKLNQHREVINQDLIQTKEEVDEMLERKLQEREQNSLISKNNRPTIVLPEPVQAEIEYSRSVDGDEEYWLQNLSAINDEVSNNDPDKMREKDASVIEFIQNEDAKKSNIGSLREMEADEEMRAGMTDAGGVHGTDLSQKKSFIGTEQEYLNRSGANFGKDDGTREKIGTEQDYYDGASAVFSNATGANALSKIGTEQNFVNKSQPDFGPVTPINKSDNIEGLNNESADFGENDLAMDKSMKGITPQVDQHGHSDESSEGIVADHRPFQGIKDAMEKQDEMRKSDIGRKSPALGTDKSKDLPQEDSVFEARDPATGREVKGGRDPGRSVDSVEEEDEDNRPSARRRIKQVLYSDKSESSVDDMMEDTPSNYNIANGRLEGKSMGLKAILLFAKNQGIQLGAGNERRADGGLPQIQEESALTPNRNDYDGEWKSMNNPMAAGGQRTRTQIAELSEVNRTIDDGQKKQGGRSKRNPGSKQFAEPEEGDLSARGAKQDLAKIQKNNFI